MVLYCIVRKCKNSTQTPGISMHRFPSDEAMKRAWTVRIRSDERKNKRNVESMRICSAHFKPEDYRIISSGKKVLKKEAEPTIFPSSSYRKPKTSRGPLQRINLPSEPIVEGVENAAVDFNDEAIEIKSPAEFLESQKSSDDVSETRKSTEFSEVDEQSNYLLNYADLPDVILLKIFSHLSFEDRCRAGCVCYRWYNISKSPAVWKKIDVKVKSPYHLLKFLLLLPSSVTYLSIFCHSLDIHHPLWFPDIMSRLHERCPCLKTLILENVFFSQRFCNAGFTTDHVLHSLQSSSSQTFKSEVTGRRDMPLCLSECCSNKINRDKFVPENRPQELVMLSLRYSRSYMCHLSSRLSQFIPRIKVLDLTYSVSVKDAVIPFFARLTHLEELYLVGCPITNSGIENLIKHLKKLKVLDLEGSRGVDDDTFEILQTYGQTLEKLYLGNTHIETFTRPIDVEDIFPRLQVLCLKNTRIDDWYIIHIIQFFPSLKSVDVSFCNFNAIFLLKNNETFRKKLINNNEGNYLSLCHHFKTKYICCD